MIEVPYLWPSILLTLILSTLDKDFSFFKKATFLPLSVSLYPPVCIQTMLPYCPLPKLRLPQFHSHGTFQPWVNSSPQQAHSKGASILFVSTFPTAFLSSTHSSQVSLSISPLMTIYWGGEQLTTTEKVFSSLSLSSFPSSIWHRCSIATFQNPFSSSFRHRSLPTFPIIPWHSFSATSVVIF